MSKNIMEIHSKKKLQIDKRKSYYISNFNNLITDFKLFQLR